MSSPWRLVPIAEIEPVQPAAEARARGWLRELRRRLRSERRPPVDPTPSHERLGPLDEARLARLVPPPPQAAQQAAFDALRGAADRAVVLRPDDGGWDEVLDGVDEMAIDRLAPPDERPPGAGLPDATRDRLRDPAPLHVVRLERWGVRHHDGLAALRELLARLADRTSWTADVGPWAWAWMRHVLPEARGLPSPVAPAALDGAALRGWLGGHQKLRLRGVGEPPDEATYRVLAERSRGEAGVAAALWRACLRDGAERPPPDEGGEDDAGRQASEAPPDPGTVWVRPPSQLELPGLATATRADLLLLHAVLLHGRPSVPVVARALDRTVDEAEVALTTLAGLGLLRREDGGRIRPAPLALPAIRSRLEAEAFAGVAA
jgi:predicted transcriptional regulator